MFFCYYVNYQMFHLLTSLSSVKLHALPCLSPCTHISCPSSIIAEPSSFLQQLYIYIYIYMSSFVSSPHPLRARPYSNWWVVLVNLLPLASQKPYLSLYLGCPLYFLLPSFLANLATSGAK